MSKRGVLRPVGLVVVGLVLFVLSPQLWAREHTWQDYESLVQQIFENGEDKGTATSLAFIEGDLHQYAVAEGTDPDHLVSLTFIEEHWSKTAGNDVIEQWVVTVAPDSHAVHMRLVENGSEVLSIENLETAGADNVVDRIVEKMTRKHL